METHFCLLNNQVSPKEKLMIFFFNTDNLIQQSIVLNSNDLLAIEILILFGAYFINLAQRSSDALFKTASTWRQFEHVTDINIF